MNKILLVDVDSKIPNLVLMKVSTFHKRKGDVVELLELGLSYYKTKDWIINADVYDKVYVSIIFTVNKNNVQIINCDDVEKGGTGYDLKVKLPKEVEEIECDYSLYPDNDISYGFITRGCIRNCYFCFVPEKEGMIHKVNDVDDIIRHRKVKFLDNNILAYSKHKEILQELIDLKIRCQFNQGLDLRLVTEENAELLSKLNYLGEYIFAFDDIRYEKIINDKLKIIKKYIKKDWRLKFFIYCHPDMKLKEDVLYRVAWCKKNKVLPYLMRDISCWGSKYEKFYIDLAAWCNQPSLFKNMPFDEFIDKRTKNQERRKQSKELFCSQNPYKANTPKGI